MLKPDVFAQLQKYFNRDFQLLHFKTLRRHNDFTRYFEEYERLTFKDELIEIMI